MVTETIIPGGGGDFTSVELWEASLLNETEAHTGVCTEVAKCNTGQVTLNASNTNSVRYLLTVAAGYRFWDVSGGSWPDAFAAMKEGAYVEHSVTETVKLDGSRWTVEHLAILCSDTTVSTAIEVEDNSYTFVRFCLIGHDGASTAVVGGITYDGADAGNNVYHDNVFISCQYTMRLQTISTVNVYGNTIFCSPTGTTRGIQRVAGTVVATNNLVLFATGGAFYNGVTGDYNVEDDNTAPGANSTHNVTPADVLTDVTRGQEDPTPLVGYPGDSTPPGQDGSVDLVGVARSAWNAGAIESLAGINAVGADTIEFGEVAERYSVAAAQAEAFELGEAGSEIAELNLATPSEGVVFDELAGLTHAAVGADGIDFGEAAARAYEVAGADQVELDDSARRLNFAKEGIEFGEEGSAVLVVQVEAEDGLTFQEGAAHLPVEGCETDYAPDPAIQADPADVLYTYLLGPWATMEHVIRLPRPDFGDVRRNGLQVVVHRTRGGQRRVYKRTPSYLTLVLQYRGLSRRKLLELEAFLIATAGEDVRLIDWEGRTWRGNILSSPADLTHEGPDDGETVLEFEGATV